MKAYLAKTKRRYIDSKDVLILAKTKKDATREFKTLEDRYMARFLRKDFTEVDIKEFLVRSVEIHGGSYQYLEQEQPLMAECFTIHYTVLLDVVIIPETQILAETDATYAEAIQIFKEQNKDVFALFIKGNTP